MVIIIIELSKLIVKNFILFLKLCNLQKFNFYFLLINKNQAINLSSLLSNLGIFLVVNMLQPTNIIWNSIFQFFTLLSISEINIIIIITERFQNELWKISYYFWNRVVSAKLKIFTSILCFYSIIIF